ncbi:MAG: RusA family crossover junction endodeoxyribonuclease [Hyphomicrobium sp.]|nr:RusA family crossover junction endodeoxyribonuclease [Hyphomicrobium sp.]MBN9277334.1 RusA family crossover junction endodeoxyribonuclease [Hyphomicrobium sp.]
MSTSEDENEDIDAPILREAEGARSGLNPMFGGWQHRFDFAPVPYGDGGRSKREFEARIRAELTHIKWMYSSEVQLDIVLHLDVQTILETSETADLDNYAKSILDGLKGPQGIMFDDTQVQGLCISWLDTYDTPHFLVRAKGLADDFLLKPVAFYEMPDGLWYPQSRLLWSDGEAEPAGDLNHFVGLAISELNSAATKRVRHELRRRGRSRLDAYRASKYVATSLRGYHRSRIDGGFPLHYVKRGSGHDRNGNRRTRTKAQRSRRSAPVFDKFMTTWR